MRWSNRVLEELNGRAEMVETACGWVQVAREGSGPAVVVIHGGPGGFDQGLIRYAANLEGELQHA